MDNTFKRLAVATTCLFLHGAVSANPPAGALASAVPATIGAKPATKTPPSAASSGFRSNPCRVASGSQLEAVEFSAFDDWQGALTTAQGDQRALVFGTMVEAARSSTLGVASPGRSATAAVAANEAVVREEQRQRLFALGLAVLLNLNARK